MLKMTFIIAMLFISFNVQSQDIDSKYLMAIIHLKSDVELNKNIKTFFKREIRRKSKFVPFDVSDRISFIGIEPFKDSVLSNQNKFDFETEILNELGDFQKKYYFKSVENKLLNNLLPITDDNLVLTFSKPIGNFLVAQVAHRNMSYSGIRFGKGFVILFLFDENGMIAKTFEQTFVYN